jgi:Ca2+-binding RTX toxin-like protein
MAVFTYDESKSDLESILQGQGVSDQVINTIVSHLTFDSDGKVPVEFVFPPDGSPTQPVPNVPDSNGQNPQGLILEAAPNTVNTDLDPALKFIVQSATDSDLSSPDLTVTGHQSVTIATGDLAGATNPYYLALNDWGNDTVYLGDGSDTVTAGHGADKIYAGDGDNDSLQAGDGGHQLLQVGDGANDTVVGGSGAHDTLIAGDGDNDSLQAGSGAHQSLQAGDGAHDTLIGGSGANDTLTAGDGAGDILAAGSGANQLLQAGDGAGDTLIGGSGANDTLIAGDGGNWLQGGTGANQSLQSGSGNDTFTAGTGGDTLVGGGGNDTFHIPGQGNDTVFGDSGDDTVVFDRDFDPGNVTIKDSTSGPFTEVSFSDTGQTIELHDVEHLVFNNNTGNFP